MKYTFYDTLVSAIAIIIFAMIFASCNKNSNPLGTTTVKCVTCANGGQCLNDTCRCPAGYEGTSCQTLSSDKFLGSWNVFEKGTLTPLRNYTIDIENNSFTSVNAIQIQEFYDTFLSSEVTGYVVLDSIYIPSQQISGKIFIGTGFIHSSLSGEQNGAITMRYAVKDVLTGKIDDFGYYSVADSTSDWER